MTTTGEPIDELNLFRRRRLPVVMGVESAECGLCCLAMIVRYWGYDIDLNALRQRFPLSMSGVNLRAVMSMADQLGFTSRAVRVELEDLDKLGAPAILHWDLNHFVVLRKVERGRAIIHDPGVGMRDLSMREMSDHFTGIALELRPAPDFTPKVEKNPTRLSSLWSKVEGVFSAGMHVLALSLVLQLAIFIAPVQLQMVVDEAIFRGDADLLLVIALGFGALALFQAILDGLRGWSLRYLGALLSFQLMGNLIHRLIRLPVGFFESRSVGDIMSRVNSTLPIKDAVTNGVATALIDGLMALLAVVLLFVYSPLLAVVVILSAVAMACASAMVYPVMRARMSEEIYASAKERTYLMESVRGAATVKSLAGEEQREGIWRNLYADVINASFSVGKYQIALASIQTGLTGLQIVLVVYVAASAIVAGSGFSVGMLFAFLAYRQIFTDRANALIGQFLQIRLLGLHIERIGDIVNATPDVRTGLVHSKPVRGAVSLLGVSFRYGIHDPLVLRDINLEIAAGQYVAIVGPSGGGKTTLVKIILALYEPDEGVLEYDGQRANPDLVRAWRARTGVVAQDDRLMSGSLADNISGFDPDLDMERVESAAKQARIHDEISRMPMQYLSLVGDMGAALSGGQRQRVMLARALYRQPAILVLDEGTANLDIENEERIADLIAGLPMTRIVIAHRRALLDRAERVLSLFGGVVHESNVA